MISFKKQLAAEDRVEQHLAVVDFAVVEMQVERAVVGEHAVSLDQARREEAR